MAKTTAGTCFKCHQVFQGDWKTTPLGLKQATCTHCGHTVTYPMPAGIRVICVLACLALLVGFILLDSPLSVVALALAGVLVVLILVDQVMTSRLGRLAMEIEAAQSGQPQPARSGPSRTGKLVFAALAIVGGVVIFLVQMDIGERPPKGWDGENSIEKTLAWVRQSQRGGVVAFFAASPRDAITQNLVDKVLYKAHRAMNQAKVYRVYVALSDGVKSDLARKYNVTKLPTMILFDRNGREIRRLEVIMPEATLTTQFFENIPIPPRTNPAGS